MGMWRACYAKIREFFFIYYLLSNWRGGTPPRPVRDVSPVSQLTPPPPYLITDISGIARPPSDGSSREVNADIGKQVIIGSSRRPHSPQPLVLFIITPQPHEWLEMLSLVISQEHWKALFERSSKPLSPSEVPSHAESYSIIHGGKRSL
eukprot:scaffold25642_cov146-Isochrysis_galbana.AAC.5